MAIEIFNRQELKFMINKEQFDKISAAIIPHMRLDKHNISGLPYRLYNLYVDTPDHALIRNSLGRPVYKEKLRLRSYAPFESDTHVFLEVKKRYKRITNKRRSSMSLSDAMSLIKTGNYSGPMESINPQVVREFETIFGAARYVPKTYITYDRIAYHSSDVALDLRITFDMNLTSRRYGEHTLRQLLMKEQIIMEIKSMYNIPLWLVDILNDAAIQKRGYSKYGQEYMTFLRSDVNIERMAAHA